MDNMKVARAERRLVYMSTAMQGNLSSLMWFPCGNKNWTPVDPLAVTLYGPNGVVLRDEAGVLIDGRYSCSTITRPARWSLALRPSLASVGRWFDALPQRPIQR